MDRLITYKTLKDRVAKMCCLKTIEKNCKISPGKGVKCNRCGNYLKCSWLDFSVSRSYGVIQDIHEQKNKIEDFIPLSAIVIKNFGETAKQLSGKFSDLFDNVKEESLNKCEILDSDKGREYVFNKDVKIEECRVLRLGKDTFVLLGKVLPEEREKLDEVLNVTFTNILE